MGGNGKMAGLKQNEGFDTDRYRKNASDGIDYYPTPPGATRALLAREEFPGVVWECACGNGKMSEVLLAHGLNVVSSDLYDYGYGCSGVDFLTSDFENHVDHIITNPPFIHANAFISKAYEVAHQKVAMLIKMTYLSGIKRYELFKRIPPARIYVFCTPIPYYAGEELKKGSFTHCWFVWDKAVSSGETKLLWIPERIVD